jgi:hypothetical protein
MRPPASTTPSGSSQGIVFGKLAVVFAYTTRDSAVPKPPISFALIITKPGETEGIRYPLEADGQFMLDLPSGTYDVAYVEIDAPDLAPKPVRAPLASTKKVQVHVPRTGCVYAGSLTIYYGRLPAVSEERQKDLVRRAAATNNEPYRLLYLPSGGLVLGGAVVAMPPVAQWPPGTQDCPTDAFTTVPV